MRRPLFYAKATSTHNLPTYEHEDEIYTSSILSIPNKLLIPQCTLTAPIGHGKPA